MIPAEVIGGLIVIVPAVVIAKLALLKAPRAIYWFTLALIAVGIGYLASVGALTDIGNAVLGNEAPPIAEPSPVSP